MMPETHSKASKSQFVARVLLSVVLLHQNSMPVQAYEEDTHFTLTYVLCRAVGLNSDEANLVANYNQGMDDSSGTVANGGLGGVIPNIEEEHLWHAIPQDGTSPPVLQRKSELWARVLAESHRESQLKRLGVFLHYQQDSWAHRHHPNHDSANFRPYKVPFGHAEHGHQPDRPPFDPVCALRCLEEGMDYVKVFLASRLSRTPNPLFDGYQAAHGRRDDTWSDPRKGRYFNQVAADTSSPARAVLTGLIRAQIDAYTTSPDGNPIFLGHRTADRAAYDSVRERFQSVCDLHNLGIVIPSQRQRVTTLTTAQLTGENLGSQDYTIRIFTGDKLWAGTDSDIFLSLRGTNGEIGEQRLNGLISGNAFERNRVDTLVLRGLASIGELTSITVRSDDRWPASEWYLGWVEISGPGLNTVRFTLNDWIKDGQLTRTLNL